MFRHRNNTLHVVIWVYTGIGVNAFKELKKEKNILEIF